MLKKYKPTLKLKKDLVIKKCILLYIKNERKTRPLWKPE